MKDSAKEDACFCSAIVCDSCDCGERIRCKMLILLALVFWVGFAIDAIGERLVFIEGKDALPPHERNSCERLSWGYHALTMGRKALSPLTIAVHHAAIMAFAFGMVAHDTAQDALQGK